MGATAHVTAGVTADPKGVAADALRAGESLVGRGVDDVVLCWLISLAPETDPAQAAREVLQQPAARVSRWRLVEVLEEIACWPRERLAGYGGIRRPRR